MEEALIFRHQPSPAPGEDSCLPPSLIPRNASSDSPGLRNPAAIPPLLPLLQRALLTSCPQGCFWRTQKSFSTRIPCGAAVSHCPSLAPSASLTIPPSPRRRSLLSSGSVHKSRASVMFRNGSHSISARPVPQITLTPLCWHLPDVPRSSASPPPVLLNSGGSSACLGAGCRSFLLYPKINPDVISCLSRPSDTFPNPFPAHKCIHALHRWDKGLQKCWMSRLMGVVLAQEISPG